MTRTAVDTNVLVRLLIQDQTDQSRAARNLLRTAPLFVLTTVLLETEWILRSVVKAGRAEIDSLFLAMLEAESIEIENADAVREAIRLHTVGMDFADALHVSQLAKSDQFVTFDRALVKLANKHINRVSVELAS